MAGTLSRRVTRPTEMMDRDRTLCVAGCFNGASMCGSEGHRQRVAREGCAECVLTIRYLVHSGRISRGGAHVGHVERDHRPVVQRTDHGSDNRRAALAPGEQAERRVGDRGAVDRWPANPERHGTVVGVRRAQTTRQSARPDVAAGRVVRAARASHKGGYHREDPAGAAHRLLLAPGRPPTVLRYAWRSPTS